MTATVAVPLWVFVMLAGFAGWAVLVLVLLLVPGMRWFFRRRIERVLYRVRIGFADEAALAGIDPKSIIVFVINHRSNMDYVLVAFLAAERTTLSFAVGEWARI